MEMNIRKDAIYNTIGNFVYLATIWIISVITARLVDFECAGVLALGMTISNIFISIASYQLRFYYAADVKRIYKDNQYILCRFMTIGISCIFCIIYCFVVGYNMNIIFSIFLFYFYKCFEMISDILYGVMQRNSKLYLCGYSMILKSVGTLIVYVMFLYIFKDLNIALIGIDLIALGVLVFYDIGVCNKFGKIQIKYSKGTDYISVLSLIKKNFPMFVMGLCYNIVPSAPRMIFERMYSTKELGYYSSMSTITVIISTGVGCVLLPLMPKYAQYYNNGKFKELKRLTITTLTITLIIGVCACGVSSVVGSTIMIMLFGSEIKAYIYLLIPLIIATTLTSMVSCMNNFFVAVDRQIFLMRAGIISVVVCIISSFGLIESFYMMGLVYSMVISQLIELVYLLLKTNNILKAKSN